MTAYEMEYLFCCGKRAIRTGCGCNLKTSTQIISFLGILITLPLMLGIFTMNWKEYSEVPIIFLVYEISGCTAPLLMFIGSLKMSFGICYVGYIMHSIYIYGLILFCIFIGLFWGIIILPVIIINPPFFVFYVFYFLFWIGYILILSYFNNVYFSFTKYIGLGEMVSCVQCENEFVNAQPKVILINQNSQIL